MTEKSSLIAKEASVPNIKKLLKDSQMKTPNEFKHAVTFIEEDLSSGTFPGAAPSASREEPSS